MDNFNDTWTEYVDSDELRNQYAINYIEDGWYTSCFDYPEGWVYIVKEEDDLFFMTIWKNDPRPQLKIMLESAVR